MLRVVQHIPNNKVEIASSSEVQLVSHSMIRLTCGSCSTSLTAFEFAAFAFAALALPPEPPVEIRLPMGADATYGRPASRAKKTEKCCFTILLGFQAGCRVHNKSMAAPTHCCTLTLEAAKSKTYLYHGRS